MIQGMAWLKELLFDTESANIEKLDKRLNTAFDPFQSLEGLNERERTKRRNEAAVALPKSSEMRSALRKLTTTRRPRGRLRLWWCRRSRLSCATAKSDLVRQLNQCVERNGAMLRLPSIISGVPVAELAIVDSQHLQVEEIFLIRRGSAALVARRPAGVEQSNSNIHLSSITSAINDYATHAFQADGGQPRFRVGRFQVNTSQQSALKF